MAQQTAAVILILESSHTMCCYDLFSDMPAATEKYDRIHRSIKQVGTNG